MIYMRILRYIYIIYIYIYDISYMNLFLLVSICSKSSHATRTHGISNITTNGILKGPQRETIFVIT